MKTTIDAMKQALDLIEVLTIPTTRGTIVKRALHEAIDREEALQASESAAVPEDDSLRKAVQAVCEGWTLPDGARKMLETALFAQPASANPPWTTCPDCGYDIARESAKPLPLTEQQIMSALSKASCYDTVRMTLESGPYDIDVPSNAAIQFTRAIEAAHNIKEQPARANPHPLPLPLTDELVALCKATVKMHKERGAVLTIHIENMADLLEEMAAHNITKEQP